MLVLQAQVQPPQQGRSLYPRLCVLVDTIPETGFVFQEKDHIYRAEVDGLVRHFRYAGPGKGMSGAEFQVEMQDGSLRQIKGPWGLSAGYTSLFFEACVDVTLTDDPDMFERQEGYQASLTVEKTLEALLAVHMEEYSDSFSWQLRVDYDITSGELSILPFIAQGALLATQLYISQEALEWMGDFSMKETCASVTAEIGQFMWKLIRVSRGYGLSPEVHQEIRDSARRLCQLSLALNQTNEIKELEEIAKAVAEEVPDAVPHTSPSQLVKETPLFPESAAPLEGEHPHSAEAPPAPVQLREEFAVDYDSKLTGETPDA